MNKLSLISGLIVIALGFIVGQWLHEPFAFAIVILGFVLAFQPAITNMVWPSKD